MSNSISPVDELMRDFDLMTGFRLPRIGSLVARNSQWRIPQASVNIRETDDAYEISVLVPGASREDVDISVNGNRLTVNAERKRDADDESASADNGGKWLHREFVRQSLSRTVTLPQDADLDSIEAREKGGVITITVKKSGRDSRKIEILCAD